MTIEHVRFIYSPLGYAGTSDPLNQEAMVGVTSRVDGRRAEIFQPFGDVDFFTVEGGRKSEPMLITGKGEEVCVLFNALLLYRGASEGEARETVLDLARRVRAVADDARKSGGGD